MGTIAEQTFTSWIEGVNNSAQSDDLAPNMVAKAINCQLTNISGGKAVYAWRPAFFGLLSAALSGNPKIISIYPYKVGSTHYLLLLGSDYKLYKYQLEGLTATAFASAITVATQPQSWVTANNTAFLVNGTDQKSFDGTTVAGFGITRPTVGAMAAAVGAAGLHNGTYELRVSFGISSLDVESSASNTAAATVTAVNQQLSWTDIPLSADSRVDRRYLYVRNTATMTNFYLATTITDNTATTATTNIADTSAYILAPSTTENEPPPTGAKFLAWHRNRIFAATDTLVYWSQLGKPTAFNTLDSKVDPNPSNGQLITGLVVYQDMLLIFKERSLYAIVGDDPNSWVVKEIFPSVGCHSSASIVVIEGKLFWWSREGPIVWTGTGIPTNIGIPMLNGTMNLINDKSYVAVHSVKAGVDIDGQRILWNLPITTDIGGADSNNLRTYILPFNYKLARWESDGWIGTNIQSMASSTENTYGNYRLYLGNDFGHLFKLTDLAMRDSFYSDASGDPVDNAYETSTTAWTTASQKTFNVLAHSTNTLKGYVMTLWSATGVYKGDRRILSNTTSTVTVDAPFDYELNPGEVLEGTYTYYITGHNLILDFPWWDFGEAFKKKRLEYIYLLADGLSVSTPVTVQVFVDGIDYTIAESHSVDLYSAASVIPKKLRTGSTGRSFKIRIIDPKNAVSRVIMAQITLRAEILTDNLN